MNDDTTSPKFKVTALRSTLATNPSESSTVDAVPGPPGSNGVEEEEAGSCDWGPRGNPVGVSVSMSCRSASKTISMTRYRVLKRTMIPHTEREREEEEGEEGGGGGGEEEKSEEEEGKAKNAGKQSGSFPSSSSSSVEKKKEKKKNFPLPPLPPFLLL